MCASLTATYYYTLCTQVCNHPDLFEPRPTLSPFRMTAIRYYSASLVLHAMQYDPFKVCIYTSCSVKNLREFDLDIDFSKRRSLCSCAFSAKICFYIHHLLEFTASLFSQPPHPHPPPHTPPKSSLYISSSPTSPTKHVCLDHLNLRLADTEFKVGAFAAFRCSQLQAPRAFLLDPLSAHPNEVDLTGERGGLLAGGDEGELGDLVLVRSPELHMPGVNGIVQSKCVNV